MKERLRIGRINYANMFPIFYMLEHESDCSAYSFIEGVPSELNRLLREGKIDISPSSSIEYLRHKDMYTILDGHSISSFGPIGSILLFSTRPLETLGGSTVLVSSQSETSVVLLDIILKKSYGAVCRLKASDAPLPQALASGHAYLLIGDNAMIENKKLAARGCQMPVAETSINRLQQINEKYYRQRPLISGLYVYDLGDIWFKMTGLPFVFALWVARKDCCAAHPTLIERFKIDLANSKAFALNNLELLAQRMPFQAILSIEEIIAYWRNISYDLNEEHKKGLELFKRYAEELYE